MPSFEEWIEQELNPATKSVTPLMRRLAAAWQAVSKAEAAGDLSVMASHLSQLAVLIDQFPQHIGSISRVITEFDVRSYLNGQFDREFRLECERANLPIEGEFPRYVISPLRVQIVPSRGGVVINQKLHRGFRPAKLAEILEAERTRIVNRGFNSRYFLADLAAVYDSLIELESAKNRVNMAGHEILLRDVYQRLVPMRQWKADYPISFFTYDLHRLFRSGEATAPDSRRLFLAPARQERLNLTVLDAAGREQQLGLIAFRQT